MAGTSGKRPRQPDYSKRELEYLYALVDKYKNVVESKETNGHFLKRKSRAWNNIAAEFNRLPYTIYREPRQLRICWKNLKQRAKQKLSISRRRRPVGGPSPEAVLSLTETAMKLERESPSNFTPLYNLYDSDDIYADESSKDESSEALMLRIIQPGSHGDFLADEKDFDLPDRAEESSLLTSRFVTTSKIDQLAEEYNKKKMEMLQIEHEAYMLANEEKREFARTEHDARMRAMEEDRVRSRELHAKRMQQLQFENNPLQ